MAGAEARTSLVVSRDVGRRRDWGRELEREGVRVVRCAARSCPLLVGGACDVLAGADAAIYDEETLDPSLFMGLVRARQRTTVLFARDVLRDGQHHAKFTRVLDHRGAATIFPHLR